MALVHVFAVVRRGLRSQFTVIPLMLQLGVASVLQFVPDERDEVLALPDVRLGERDRGQVRQHGLFEDLPVGAIPHHFIFLVRRLLCCYVLQLLFF